MPYLKKKQKEKKRKKCCIEVPQLRMLLLNPLTEQINNKLLVLNWLIPSLIVLVGLSENHWKSRDFHTYVDWHCPCPTAKVSCYGKAISSRQPAFGLPPELSQFSLFGTKGFVYKTCLVVHVLLLDSFLF